MNIKNHIFKGANGKESLLDLQIPESFSGKLIVFVHGYMGFKDWGCWEMVQDYFLNLGFGFCKYNVSHNGCTTADEFNFTDLEAFSRNNYTKECDDLKSVINFLTDQLHPLPEIFLSGHSRGGGIALLGSDNPKIKKLTTWAAISDIGRRFPTGEALENWKNEGFYMRLNGRTNQEMPHAYAQYEDFLANSDKLNIENAAKKMDKPWLILHGDEDTTVSIDEGKELANWSNRELRVITGANHTFGSAHPWKGNKLPEKLAETCRLTAEFFLKSSY